MSSRWLLSFILILPAAVPYFSHFVFTEGLAPTGFIQGDQPYYLANARGHFDSGSFSFFYENPCDPDITSPKVYFQPHLLILGVVIFLTGASPGFIYILFGFLAALICARVAIALFESFAGSLHHALFCLTLFFWGGGLLVLTGSFLTGFYALLGAPLTLKGVFQFDPSFGWWFLNFGRNLVLPTEAYYHALFFGTIFLLKRQRFLPALTTSAILSASHPYTGVELLAILAVWVLVELFLKKPLPLWLAAGIVLLFLAHVSYYLVYLPGFPSHKTLMTQWQQPWNLPWESLLPAYGLTGTFAIWRLWKKDRRDVFFSGSENRLLLCWFALAFLLANHHYFMKSMQPLHFTRGYIWTSLFFIGLPMLSGMVQRLRQGGLGKSKLLLAGLLIVFLLDNTVWLNSISFFHRSDVRLTRQQATVIDWIKREGTGSTLILSEDEGIAYLSLTYTPVRSWYSHPFNTPEASFRKEQLKNYFADGIVEKEWEQRKIIVVTSAGKGPPGNFGVEDFYANDAYSLYVGTFTAGHEPR